MLTSCTSAHTHSTAVMLHLSSAWQICAALSMQFGCCRGCTPTGAAAGRGVTAEQHCFLPAQSAVQCRVVGSKPGASATDAESAAEVGSGASVDNEASALLCCWRRGSGPDGYGQPVAARFTHVSLYSVLYRAPPLQLHTSNCVAYCR